MKRVLIVDDKEENAYYLRALLTAHGCEVETASHGAEALVKARRAPPDYVISDLLMPVMDGYTLLRHWKADPRLRHTPFVVYTATYTEPEDERLALRLGADAFILKPAEPDDFLARLRELESRVVTASPADLHRPSADEREVLREYSQTLIRKLEEKTLQLEHSNRSLQQDIAARQEVEAALRESEERFRQLAESIDDVFCLSEPEGSRCLYVSPAYASIWGRSCDSLYDAPESWLDAVHAEDRDRVIASLPSRVSGHWDEVFRIVRPDGSVRTVRARAFPVRDRNGRVYRVAGIMRDITEHRRLEEQLTQAQKMEAVGRMAGGIAHDFNNILFVIMSYAHLAQAQAGAVGPLRAALDEVQRASERASELTQQLLTFSQHRMLQPRVLDLTQVVVDMEGMLRRLGEDIELVILTDGQRGRIHAEQVHLEQVIMNLAVNARDAMPKGGKLTIETRNVQITAQEGIVGRRQAAGHYVALLVRDSGTGMDEATRERIFEPFFTTKEKGKGTGLGLATVYGIVKQCGGFIHVESELGRGTTFEIYLPRTDRAADAQPSESPAPSTLRGSETVLLVEDDDQVRTMMHGILRSYGYDVLDARNGGEAFLVSEQIERKIHLLLTDVIMPRMSGIELAQRLAKARPDIRILYVSGYAEDAIVQGQSPHGQLVFVQKPVTPEVLLRKVREVLDGPAAGVIVSDGQAKLA